MSRDIPGWIGRLLNNRYKTVGTLATVLFLGFGLYLFIQQLFPSVPQAEEQASTPTSAPAQQHVLFQDDFADPGSGWPVEELDKTSFGYQAPAFYFLQVKAPNENLTIFRGLELQDFSARTKVTVSYTDSLSGDFRYGLAFRRSGEAYYAFVMFPRRRTWQVIKYAPTGPEILAEGRRGSIQGLFQVSTLRVDASGAKFTFYVNDRPITEVTDSDYRSGDVGFIVETGGEELVRTLYNSLIIQEFEEGTAAIFTNSSPPPSPTPSLIFSWPDVTPTHTPSPASTPTPLPVLPTLLPSATPKRPSPTPSPIFTDTATPVTSTSIPPLTVTAVPTSPSPVSTSVAPATTLTPASTPTSSIPAGAFELLKPLDLNKPSFGPTDFEWRWSGPLPAAYGFEVRVWREGEPPAGVHDAVLDNQRGNIETISPNVYRLSTNIRDAAGVLGRSGEYLWTVAVVQISPDYADLGQQAPPARLRFEAGGSGGGGDGGGGGGVGIK